MSTAEVIFWVSVVLFLVAYGVLKWRESESL